MREYRWRHVKAMISNFRNHSIQSRLIIIKSNMKVKANIRINYFVVILYFTGKIILMRKKRKNRMILWIESIFFVYYVIFDIKIVQIGELLLIMDRKGRKISFTISWIVNFNILDCFEDNWPFLHVIIFPICIPENE